MNQIRLCLLGVIGFALSVSCGGEKKSGFTAAGARRTSTKPSLSAGLSCDKMSAAEVSSSLGISGFQGPTVDNSYGTSTVSCSYKTPDNSRLDIRYYPGAGRSTFDHNRDAINQNFPQYPAQAVTGIGDAAFVQRMGKGSIVVSSVFFLKGSTMASVVTSSGATIDQVKQLATLVASKL